MDFTIPEDARMLQQTVRRFVQEELVPLERGLGEELPRAEQQRLMQLAKDTGLFMMHVPTEYGGGGVDTLGMALVLEETAKTIVESEYLLGIDQPINLMFNSTPEQKEQYLYPVVRGERYGGFALSEPNAGSDASGIQTTAVRDGDNYVINGAKLWVSRMLIADFCILFATVDKTKRARGVTAFYVDKGTPGFSVVRPVETMGENHSRGPTELLFENCVIPASNRLGEEGQGFKLAQARLGAQRTSIAARCVGVSQRALDMTLAFTKQRITFGEPLSSRQGVQWMLADAAMQIHAARLMTWHCAWKWDQGEDVRKEASMVKLYASEMSGKILDLAIQLHGGLGYSKELPLERMYRQNRMMRIVEGASEIHRNVIAREIMRD
jgi:acyl-CoA dehydrogenase